MISLKLLVTFHVILANVALVKVMILQVKKCPESGEEYLQRSILVICPSGKQYHCLWNEERKLVELCMKRYIISQDGCPLVNTNVSEPFILRNEPCLQNITGCPPRGSKFWSTHVFQYSSCLESELKESTQKWNLLSRSTETKQNEITKKYIFTTAQASLSHQVSDKSVTPGTQMKRNRVNKEINSTVLSIVFAVAGSMTVFFFVLSVIGLTYICRLRNERKEFRETIQCTNKRQELHLRKRMDSPEIHCQYDYAYSFGGNEGDVNDSEKSKSLSNAYYSGADYEEPIDREDRVLPFRAENDKLKNTHNVSIYEKLKESYAKKYEVQQRPASI